MISLKLMRIYNSVMKNNYLNNVSERRIIMCSTLDAVLDVLKY